MNKKADQLLSRMTEAEWTELILHLGRYALRTSGNLRWRTGNKRELPGGETADSIVSKAIEKVFSGERKWDPEANPSLRKYLMDVIDSLFSQLVNGEDNKKFEIILDRHDEDGNLLSEKQTRHPNASAEWLARPPLTPEEEILVQEQNQRNEEALGAIVDDCDDDPVLRKVLEAMFDGDENPRSIADKKGLTRQEVYAASKRLDTKIAALKKRFVVRTTLPVLKGKQND